MDFIIYLNIFLIKSKSTWSSTLAGYLEMAGTFHF
jgi:hypothetical protein